MRALERVQRQPACFICDLFVPGCKHLSPPRSRLRKITAVWTVYMIADISYVVQYCELNFKLCCIWFFEQLWYIKEYKKCKQAAQDKGREVGRKVCFFVNEFRGFFFSFWTPDGFYLFERNNFFRKLHECGGWKCNPRQECWTLKSGSDQPTANSYSS